MTARPSDPAPELLPPNSVESNCPFLGTPGDPTTHYRYPCRANRCFAQTPPQTIQFDHQQGYCLGSNYLNCPVFIREGAAKPLPELPEAPLAPPRRRPFRRRNPLKTVGILLAAGLLLSWLIPNLFPAQSSAGPESPTPSPAPTLTAAPPQETLPLIAASPTRPPTHTLSPTPTRTSPPPTITPTPFPTPGPGLATPFGDSPSFVIHLVQPGESFTRIAAQYGADPDVLAAVNTLVEGQSLWPGRLIVVPLGVSDSASLPRFQVFLTAEATTLAELAARFQADAALIRLFNALGPGPELPAGRWLIIPLPPETP